MTPHIFATPYNASMPQIGDLVVVQCGKEIPMNKFEDVSINKRVIPDGICPKCMRIESSRQRIPRLNTFMIIEFEDADLIDVASCPIV